MNAKLGHVDFIYLGKANPNIICVPRYATKHNFTGKPMNGYLSQNIVISKALLKPLNKAQSLLDQMGYTLVVYDSYRPHKAVQFYLKFIEDKNDFSTKQLYFPHLKSKKDLIDIGYVATKCPHSRGCAVDVTILKKEKKMIPLSELMAKDIKLQNCQKTIKYLDDGTQFMGTHFDFFDQSSHWDTDKINQKAKINRGILLQVMQKCGFQAYQNEWWHFQLSEQPYPGIYFDFDIV